ncbi:MAG: STAS domain-containing protein [Chitinophagaceae bacterium]|nr:STAS domain-containing protein [Chitinophagaceae bacterium]
MEIKIDTKEKFEVITPLNATFDDNITSDFNELCATIFEKEKKSIIVKLNHVESISLKAIETLQLHHQKFYENNLSFVICELQSNVLKHFKDEDFIDGFNYAPSESEAWDLVQMEEIERELFSDDE